MTKRKTYQVTVERDGDWWLVRVPEISRATQARRLDQVEAMARDLIALIEDVDENSFDLIIGWDLKKANKEVVLAALESRIKAKVAQAEASHRLRQAARKLTGDGLTVRDAGALLDVSYQRIQQLLEEDESGSETLYDSAIIGAVPAGLADKLVGHGGSVSLSANRGAGSSYAVANKAAARPISKGSRALKA